MAEISKMSMTSGEFSVKDVFEIYRQALINNSTVNRFEMIVDVIDVNAGLSYEEAMRRSGIDLSEGTIVEDLKEGSIALFRERAKMIIVKCYDMVDFVKNNESRIVASATDRKIIFSSKYFDKTDKYENFQEFVKIVESQYWMAIRSARLYLSNYGIGIGADLKIPFFQNSLTQGQ